MLNALICHLMVMLHLNFCVSTDHYVFVLHHIMQVSNRYLIVCAGIDPRLWKQAQADNPNPEKYLPVPMVGFSEVSSTPLWTNDYLKLRVYIHHCKFTPLQAKCPDNALTWYLGDLKYC